MEFIRVFTVGIVRGPLENESDGEYGRQIVKWWYATIWLVVNTYKGFLPIEFNDC